jgi:hypothetical protein
MTDWFIYLTKKGCLVVFTMAVMAGLFEIALWLMQQLIRQTIGAKALYDGYSHYLLNKRRKERGE